MLSISNPIKSAGMAVAYYLDERKEDYYLHGVDKRGHWFGGAAAPCGLRQREVTPQAFRNLLDGFSPDGRHPLVQNAGRAGRDTCWDMTFSVPKEVAVFWAMSAPANRRLIEQELQASVQTVLTKAERIGGITRRGPGGRIKEHADLLWATFVEGTSRAQDPQPHVHAILINLGRRADGRFGALYTPNLFCWKMPLGAMFQAELASRLARRFGLQIEPRKVGFGIQGVPQDLCRHFSKRRQVIERTMAQRGVAGAIQAKTAAKDTRPPKQEVPADRLFPHWQKIGAAFDWTPEQIVNPGQPSARHTVTQDQFSRRIRRLVQETPTQERTRSRLVRAAARAAFQQGVDGLTLFECLHQLRLADGSKALWYPAWQEQAVERQAATREPDRGRHQSRARTAESQARSQGPGRKAGPKILRRPEPTAQAEAKHSEIDGQPLQLRPVPHAAPTNPVRLKPEPMRGEQLQSPEWFLPTPPQSKQGGGDRSRQQSRPQRGSPTNPTLSPRRETRRQVEPALAHGRRPASQHRPQTGKAHLSHCRRLLQLHWEALYAKRPWVAARGRLVHWHWHQPFPRALWGRLRHLQLPSIGIELPRLGLGAPKPYVPRWWSIRWKQNLPLGELRIQDRILFPNAPKWSPFYRLSLPALRFSAEKSKWTSMKASSKPQRASRQQSKREDHGHSH